MSRSDDRDVTYQRGAGATEFGPPIDLNDQPGNWLADVAKKRAELRREQHKRQTIERLRRSSKPEK